MRLVWILAAAVAVSACGRRAGSEPDVDAGESEDPEDAGVVDGGQVDAGAVDGGGLDAGDSGTVDAGGAVVRRVDEVFGAACPGAAVSDAGANGDFRKLTLSAVDAKCNDGTPATMFVKAGTGPSAGRWIFHLQGGGSCAGYDECLDRFCNDSSLLMSSKAQPAGMIGTGMFGASAQNPISSWNQVFIPYCSSDAWMGENGHAVQTSSDGGESYVLVFNGHRIVERALQRLAFGALSDDGMVTMPALSSASFVVLTGSSAGSVGAQMNADWMRARFDAGVRFSAVFDSVVQFPYEFVGDGGFAARNEVNVRFAHDFMFSDAGWHPHLDESCVTFHDAGTDAWRCFDLGHSVANHISAPFFARADLSDPNRITMNPIQIDAGLHADYQRQTLLRLRRAPENSEEAATLSQRPAVFGPNCGTHVVLNTGATLIGDRVSDDAGTQWSMGQAVLTWLNDGGFGQAVDDLQNPTSVCP